MNVCAGREALVWDRGTSGAAWPGLCGGGVDLAVDGKKEKYGG